MKLQLYYPLKPYSINQKFGENNACVQDSNLPITKRRVIGKVLGFCPLGYSELYPQLFMLGHTGMDLMAQHGQELYHCGPEGTVEEIQTEPERGLGISIVTKEKFDFEGGTYQAKLRYWHLKGFNVKLGDIVKLGDLIGWCDNTGVSAGDHLHFELKPVANGSNVFQNNGYFGSVDPEPYFVGEYAFIKRQLKAEYLTRDLYYMTSGDEVKRLQSILNDLGYFTFPENTGNYKEVTRQAVFDFQKDYVKLSSWEYFITKGKICGPKTRRAINSLIDNNKNI